jgi:trigger factor
MSNLNAVVLKNKLTDWVLKQAIVTEKEDFFEVIKKI